MDLTYEEAELNHDSLAKAMEEIANKPKEKHIGKQPGEKQALEIYGTK